MRTLLALLAAPLLIGASPADSFRHSILDVHQAERAAVGVPGLVWNDRLAAGATRWARRLARMGQLQHEADWTGDPTAPGENLWMGTRGYWSPAQMVSDWASEKRHFRRGVFPNVSRNGDYGEVGHYTQMVWRTSWAVGCGMATDGDMDYLVCRYENAGNVYGQRVF